MNSLLSGLRLYKALFTALVLLSTTFANSALCEKLIFLDIDGVLNNAKSDVSQLYIMEKELLKILSPVIKATGAKIVMNSTWRYTKTTRGKFINHKHRKKYIPLAISYTPNFGTGRPEEVLWWLEKNTNYFGEMIRDKVFIDRSALMISKYSDDPNELPTNLFTTFNGELGNKPKLDVTHWVAVDDLDFTKENPPYDDLIKGHFVHIDNKVGLTLEKALEIVKLLEGDTKEIEKLIKSNTKK